MFLQNYTIRSPIAYDLERCYEIESTAYTGGEAATKEKIQKRINNYPEGFMIIEIDDVVAGFINSGSTNNVQMSDESLKELVGHDPAGKHNVIMSVVVHPGFQGQGISSILMMNYILRMRRSKKESIQLMCKDKHIGFYEKFGFKYIRESKSTHGGIIWYEMALYL